MFTGTHTMSIIWTLLKRFSSKPSSSNKNTHARIRTCCIKAPIPPAPMKHKSSHPWQSRLVLQSFNRVTLIKTLIWSTLPRPILSKNARQASTLSWYSISWTAKQYVHLPRVLIKEPDYELPKYAIFGNRKLLQTCRNPWFRKVSSK